MPEIVVRRFGHFGKIFSVLSSPFVCIYIYEIIIDFLVYMKQTENNRSIHSRLERYISMSEYKLAQTETKFADLIWRHEPITSMDLVKLCEKEMHWKKSTTYTVLKKLCDRGIFQNDSTLVTSLIKKDEFYAGQSRRFVEDSFGGSLPKFLTAFIGGGKLSEKQAEELKKLIDQHKEG